MFADLKYVRAEMAQRRFRAQYPRRFRRLRYRCHRPPGAKRNDTDGMTGHPDAHAATHRPRQQHVVNVLMRSTWEAPQACFGAWPPGAD